MASPPQLRTPLLVALLTLQVVLIAGEIRTIVPSGVSLDGEWSSFPRGSDSALGGSAQLGARSAVLKRDVTGLVPGTSAEWLAKSNITSFKIVLRIEFGIPSSEICGERLIVSRALIKEEEAVGCLIGCEESSGHVVLVSKAAHYAAKTQMRLLGQFL